MPSRVRSPLRAAIAIELARADKTQRDLAALLRVPDTTLSDWLREAHPIPADLPDRIERALNLVQNSLPRPAGKARALRKRGLDHLIPAADGRCDAAAGVER